MIRYLTAGESHGDKLIGIIEGFPANIYLDEELVNKELRKRQKGYGRSNRMLLEKDEIKILSGIYKKKTTASPITISIENRGNNIDLKSVTRPRPGHADLAGALKYNQKDARSILERASARETAMKVAVGGICKLLLKEFDIEIYSHVINIGGIEVNKTIYQGLKIENLKELDNSTLRVLDKSKEEEMIALIEQARLDGDTLGGIFEIIAINIPVGLGSHVNWDRKLDSKISYNIMGIQGIKGIEFGQGFHLASLPGSKIHDEIFFKEGKYYRKTNNAGGIEGGISNGENIVLRAIMKPIPTLKKPLKTVDIIDKRQTIAQFERSDVCAVPAASIVGENVLAYVLANEMKLKFAGDSIEEMKENYLNYIKKILA